MEERIKTGPRELGATTCGLKPNFAAALSYLLGFVTGFLFVLVEKENKFVRFHAIQSIITWVAYLILVLILASIWQVMLVAGFVLWLTLIAKAYRGESFKLPFFGDLADKNS